MRRIDGDSLIEFIENRYDITWKNDYEGGIKDACTDILEKISKMPTIEPERKKGKWIDAVLPNDNGGLPVQVCDQCNTFFPLAYTGGGHRFCPHCGADMRGDNHDQSK